jgi:hypothetical protein
MVRINKTDLVTDCLMDGMEVSGQLHALVALHIGDKSLVSIDMRLGGPQTSSGSGGEKVSCLCWEFNPDSSPFQPVT